MLLAQLLEVDPLFEEVYRCNKDEITRALAKGEWTALRPEMRLKLLVWLTDAVTICETVRARVPDTVTDDVTDAVTVTRLS